MDLGQLVAWALTNPEPIEVVLAVFGTALLMLAFVLVMGALFRD